jgi:hypothetical protein
VRGLPGSGKTTLAQKIADEHSRVVEIDDLPGVEPRKIGAFVADILGQETIGHVILVGILCRRMHIYSIISEVQGRLSKEIDVKITKPGTDWQDSPMRCFEHAIQRDMNRTTLCHISMMRDKFEE